MDSNIKIALCIAAIVPFCLCCNESTEATADPCLDTEQLPIDTAMDADLLATVVYDELVEIDAEGKTDKSTIITADFADVSKFEITTKATPFNHSCVGILGRPTSNEEMVILTVNEVIIDSEKSGQTVVEKNAAETFFKGFEGDFFSQTGGEKITANISSSDEDGMYPPFSETVLAPAALENYSAAVTSTGTLLVEWEQTDSTYMEIVLRSIADNDDLLENRVRCYFLADDGCFEVPYSAMEWLLSTGASNVKVRMERHMSKLSSPAQNAILEIDAMRSIEFNISI